MFCSNLSKTKCESSLLCSWDNEDKSCSCRFFLLLGLGALVAVPIILTSICKTSIILKNNLDAKIGVILNLVGGEFEIMVALEPDKEINIELPGAGEYSWTASGSGFNAEGTFIIEKCKSHLIIFE